MRLCQLAQRHLVCGGVVVYLHVFDDRPDKPVDSHVAACFACAPDGEGFIRFVVGYSFSSDKSPIKSKKPLTSMICLAARSISPQFAP